MARSTNWAPVKLTHWIGFSWLQWSRLRCPVTDASSAGYMYPTCLSLAGVVWIAIKPLNKTPEEAAKVIAFGQLSKS